MDYVVIYYWLISMTKLTCNLIFNSRLILFFDTLNTSLLFNKHSIGIERLI